MCAQYRSQASVSGPDRRRVLGYRGYATRWRALALGRVLETHNVVPGELNHGGWRNLVNSVRRLNSDPVPHARLVASIGESAHELRADDEGFVHEWLKLPTPLADDQWHALELVLDIPDREGAPRTTSRVLVPSPHAAFGVISDMDDTVLQSDATALVRAAKLMLLENARTRLPFPGVAAFYRALHDGIAQSIKNPIFYVSSSPWNMYDVIADFLDAREIPAGPMMLRDWDLASALAGHEGHKLLLIREILDAYPWMRFILVGDSGQQDPEIYSSLVSEYPGRILAIYIRDVSRSDQRSAAISVLAEHMTGSQCSLVLSADTLTVARHAAEHGWIDPARLAEIGGEARP
jgi:phosphatidate phosphatase APP1